MASPDVRTAFSGTEYCDYDLSNEHMRGLTADLLKDREPTCTMRYVTYMISANYTYSNIARTVERTVFDEAFGNDADEMKKEYGPYEEQSRFLLSVDRVASLPVGVLRIIENGDNGLKSLNDFTSSHPDLSMKDIEAFHGVNDFENCWDIGTVAILPGNRSSTGEVSLQLYRGMYRTAEEEGVSQFVSIVDHKAYRMLTGHLGIPFVSLAGSEPFEYLGSTSSHALYGSVQEFYPKMSEKLQQVRGSLARSAMLRLVEGTHDAALQF